MNWDQLEGKWRQVKGAVKQRWGNLTDDDLTFIDGSKDKFLGRLQERYGLTKEQAQNQVNDWILTVSVETPAQPGPEEHAYAQTGKPEARPAKASRH